MANEFPRDHRRPFINSLLPCIPRLFFRWAIEQKGRVNLETSATSNSNQATWLCFVIVLLPVQCCFWDATQHAPLQWPRCPKFRMDPLFPKDLMCRGLKCRSSFGSWVVTMRMLRESHVDIVYLSRVRLRGTGNRNPKVLGADGYYRFYHNNSETAGL